jgi:heat-inducible transcriptional repressor
VLRAVVQSYVEQAAPVASKRVAASCGLGLSPATVRGVMADLEVRGLLIQEHRSSGRLPSEAGLRLYVDSILEVERLGSGQRSRIRRAFRRLGGEPQRALREASRLLSELSEHAGVVLAPRISETPLRSARFLHVQPGAVLAILMDEAGFIYSRIVPVDDDLTQRELDRFAGYIQARLRGRSLQDLRELVAREAEEEAGRFSRALVRLLSAARKALEAEAETLFVGGRINVLNHPEFADLGLLRLTLKALEEKRQIIRLLDRTAAADGVRIVIGGAGGAALAGLSLVSSAYCGAAGEFVGSLGVVGPTRMDYARVVPIVAYTARAVSQVLHSN